MVDLEGKNAKTDCSLIDEMKSMLLEYGHELDLPVTNARSWEIRLREQRK